MWSNRNSHTLLVGMQNGTDTLEDRLVVSYRTKHTVTIKSSHHAPTYLPKGVGNLHLHKTLHRVVHGSFTHNGLNLEATKTSSRRRMNKLWCIQTMERYLVLKKVSYQSLKITRMNLKGILLRSQSEMQYTVGLQLCDIPEKAKLWRQ